MADLLVVGARPGSLGEAVTAEAQKAGMICMTAGISPDEDRHMDLVNEPMYVLRTLLEAWRPKHVVCTAGINFSEEEAAFTDPSRWYLDHFETNVVGPMRLLHEWAKMSQAMWPGRGNPGHYVAISSNSATLPRSSSAAYCASKAALSQALRVKAREAQGGDKGYIVYGYEPGLLAGTPMTSNTELAFDGPLHRMRGRAVERGIPVTELAAQIVAGLQVPGVALNGSLIRYDTGEL